MIKKSNVKIANIIEDGRLAGPQVRISEVAKKLDDKYHTTVILPVKDNQRFKQKLIDYGVDYKEFPLHRLTKQKKEFFLFCVYFVYELFLLWQFFKKNHFDIVHASGGSWQWKGVIAGKLAGCKVVWHLNDTKMPSYIKLIFKFLAKHCTHKYITAGYKVKNYYLNDMAIEEEAVHVIQAPVDCALFSSELNKPDEKLEKFESIKVVTVANVNPIKGLETLIQSFSNLNSEKIKVDCFIVGPVFESQKNYFDSLKQLVLQYNLTNIHFYGGVDDVKSILVSADIYVCSSLAEASPVSVWEAMAMGKPIVTTNVGDAPRFVRNGVNGFVIDVRDQSSMAKAIGELVDSPQLRDKFGVNSRQIALQELDIQQCVVNHQYLYQSLMQ